MSSHNLKISVLHVAVLAGCMVPVYSATQSQALPAQNLTPAEVKAALTTPVGSGFVEIMDQNMFDISACQAQIPLEFLYTPQGWLSARNQSAKEQYLSFAPTAEDTLRALTIISRGCATGSPTGPACDSITRVALLSDKRGTFVAESILSNPIPVAWHNGFGATAQCSNLVSKFAMADIRKAQNAKGEFLIATFAGSTLLKTYTVKEKFIKRLGLR